LLDEVVSAVKLASQAVLPFYHGKAPMEIDIKVDGSAVTAADCCLDILLRQHLLEILPDVPVLSEEGFIPEYDERSLWNTYWCVDPLDGTRGFIAGSDEFSVSVALVHHHKPILGVIYAPVMCECYFAAVGVGSFMEAEGHRSKLALSSEDSVETRWLTGHYISPELVSALDMGILTQCHSAIKFGRIASGAADCYPKIGKTLEWDVAAGQVIIEQAGGGVLDFNGKPLQYNAHESLVNPRFIAMGNPKQFQVYLDVVKSLRRKM